MSSFEIPKTPEMQMLNDLFEVFPENSDERLHIQAIRFKLSDENIRVLSLAIQRLMDKKLEEAGVLVQESSPALPAQSKTLAPSGS